MLCKSLLCCVLLLVTAGPLLTHPISHSSEMSSTGPASGEEVQVVSPEEMALSDQDYISYNAPGFGFPTLHPERNSLSLSVLDPSQPVQEVLLERPSLDPLALFLGLQTDYRKRATTECFWKYCV